MALLDAPPRILYKTTKSLKTHSTNIRTFYVQDPDPVRVLPILNATPEYLEF